MDECIGETWRFTARAGQADRVYLVLDGPTSPSRWIQMQQDAAEPGVWTTDTAIPAGRYRLRYFTAENGAYLNCGTAGLFGERLTAQDPAVQIDHFGLAASA